MAGLRERFPIRRVLRLLGWNVLILFVLLALAAGGAEAYLRLTASSPDPFWREAPAVRLAPGVGVLWAPHAEVRHTNGRDYWQVSHANSLGFLGREPPGPERAAESCHVTLIGDSFVEGKEVPVADRLRAQLEGLAARDLPAADVTVSAFGYGGTGQINQLAFYDAYARNLSPDVVVLVFVRNDFQENSLGLMSWFHGFDPRYPPYLFAWRGANGEMEFVPPAADLEDLRANRLPVSPEPETPGRRVERGLRERSRFADWLWGKIGGEGGGDLSAAQYRERAELIASALPVLAGWRPLEFTEQLLLAENPRAVVREALDALLFALEQFRERAERADAALLILASLNLGGEGDPYFDLLRERVAAVGGDIPLISQHDHIIAAGGEVAGARWEHDYHWNAAGHRWAAEAIWEWLRANPEVCD